MFKRLSALFLISLCFVSSVVSQVDSFLYDFSQSTAEENGVTITGAGFGSIAEADYSFGAIPTDNAFEGATDGNGLIIQADPGEGVMVFTPFLQIEKTALIRCSIRSSAPHVSAYIATIDQGKFTFVSTITPNNGEFFHGKYNRLADIFLPPSTGFQGLVQIINTSQTEPLTVYIDNLEVIPSGTNEISFSQSDVVGSSMVPVATPTPVSQFTVDLDLPPGSIPFEMVLIPAGTFMMGSADSEIGRDSDEGPQHQVTISKPFYMGKYEVTQAQWYAVMGYNPSYLMGDNLPVEQVSWNDVQEFIQKLNQLGQGTFRLPTEAEWEYACRAGTSTRYYWGEDLDGSQIGQYSWYYNNSSNRTHLVGQKLPNAWGLYDMIGNVWEWCQDWYGEYSALGQEDPTGPSSGSYRVMRGGGWNYSAADCRSSNRDRYSPDNRNSSYGSFGFRLLRSDP